MPFLVHKSPKSPMKPPKSPTGGIEIHKIFPNDKLAVFRIRDYKKRWNIPFFVQKSPKSPTEQPKIATWQVQKLENIPKLQISGFQNLRLSKTLKYVIFRPKIAKIAHEIARNRPKSPPGLYTINNYAIWVEEMHFCGKSEFPRGLML